MCVCLSDGSTRSASTRHRVQTTHKHTLRFNGSYSLAFWHLLEFILYIKNKSACSLSWRWSRCVPHQNPFRHIVYKAHGSKSNAPQWRISKKKKKQKHLQFVGVCSSGHSRSTRPKSQLIVVCLWRRIVFTWSPVRRGWTAIGSIFYWRLWATFTIWLLCGCGCGTSWDSQPCVHILLASFRFVPADAIE